MKGKTLAAIVTLMSGIILFSACSSKGDKKESQSSSSAVTTQAKDKSKAKTSKSTSSSEKKSKSSNQTKKEATTKSSPSAKKTAESKTSSSITPSTTETSNPQTASNSEATPVTGMNVEAIAKGDFSSIAGTWQNDLGQTLVFNNNGLVSDENVIGFLGLSDQGLASFGLQPVHSAVGGAGLYMIPQGKNSPSGLNFGQDAMTAGQSAGSENHPFYKVSSSTAAQPFSNPSDATTTIPEGSIAIIRDVPVYAFPDRLSEPVFDYPAGSYVLCDQYFEQDGEYWYSYISETGERYYFAVSDM
ncbi:DUF6287 domain-containing protein [Streptococcus rifensis]